MKPKKLMKMLEFRHHVQNCSNEVLGEMVKEVWMSTRVGDGSAEEEVLHEAAMRLQGLKPEP